MDPSKVNTGLMAHADLCFILDTEEWVEEKPYRIVGPLPEDQETARTNIKTEIRSSVPIYDGRPRKADFSLDVHGFEYVHYEPQGQISSATDVDTHLRNVAGFLKNKFQTQHVYPYDLRVCRRLARHYVLQHEVANPGAGSVRTWGRH